MLKGECIGFLVICTINDIESFCDGRTDFIIGIGNNHTRKFIAEKYDINWATLIHPSAQIAFNVSIDKGTVVMAAAVINTCASIEKHCIINTGSIVGHDNKIDDYPWDIIDCGVSKQFLRRERDKAYGENTTPNCREHCSGCGANKMGGERTCCPKAN